MARGDPLSLPDETSPVLTERRGATLLITLNRPAQRNALDLAMRDALAAAIVEARDDADVKSVVLAGAGGAFCAGGDLRGMGTERLPAFQNRLRIKRIHLWFHELVNLEKPVVAAIDGPAFGGGFNLALAADFILASPAARLCAVFARVGLVPDIGGLFLLPRIVGLQRAKEIIFSARVIEPDEALRLGILYAIHERERLLNEALTLASRFHSAPIEALGAAKTLLNQSFNLDQRALADFEGYAQALAFDTDYHREAVRRFIAKEPLAFSWDTEK
jgi:2-(1,2-epoxy-1,2-dihydrophenyl)acetyl-CoA isomerase